MLEKSAAILFILMKTKKWSCTFLSSFLLLFLSLHFSAQKVGGIYISGDASIHSSDEAFNSALEKSVDLNKIILSTDIENNVEKIIVVSENKSNHLSSKSNQKNSEESEVIKIAKKQKKEQFRKQIPAHKVEAKFFVDSPESDSLASRSSSSLDLAIIAPTLNKISGKAIFEKTIPKISFSNFRISNFFHIYSTKYSLEFNRSLFARPPPELIFS